MKKSGEEKVISELKTRILGVMNSQNIYYDSLKSAEERLPILERLREEVNQALEGLRKNFKGHRKASVIKIGRRFSEAINEEITESQKEVKQFSLLQPQKSLQGGKPKIPTEVAIVLLDAFDTCERKGIDTDWIRELLSAKGELRKTEKQIIVNPLSSLPITPVIRTDKKWVYSMKETLLRSIVSRKGNSQKKKDAVFRAKEEAFYQIIRSRRWKQDWRSCLSEIEKKFVAIETQIKK